MRNELLTTFRDQVAELKERLPKLKGEPRSDAMEQLESVPEFLELIELIGRRPQRSAAQGDGAAKPSA
jgi:hypothetical protein